MSFLRKLGCEEIQGYYFSKPLTAEEISARLKLGSLGSPVVC
jgi:EAL domain-containing protein (putative c-di-GMP-specific phosphodiesterase class I)